jgi:putative ubiquitin-RnfH superfamily antitoxin RatB of RatAB toxin-antitoxin module
MMKIEVVYALPDEQTLLSVEVPEKCSVLDGVKMSGILERYPELDSEALSVGIFSQAVRKPEDAWLNEGDRIEIYRPLIKDPKAERKKRAAAKAKEAESKAKSDD